MRVIDLTVLPSEVVATWPGSLGYSRSLFRSIGGGDRTNDSQVVYDMHVGTHIESGDHHGLLGKRLEDFFADRSRVLKTQVVEAHSEIVEKSDIERISQDSELVMFKTSNSRKRLLGKPFRADFVSLSVAAAESLCHYPNLVGIGWDYISIEDQGSDGSVHKKLFDQQLFIIESLDLTKIREGAFSSIVSCVMDRSGEASTAQVLLLAD